MAKTNTCSQFVFLSIFLYGSAVFSLGLSGTYTIPGGTYSTISAAISALNTNGVAPPGVTFNVTAGYTETFSSSTTGIIIATGTASAPIVFQKSGPGTNPLVTAGTGTQDGSSGLDGIIVLSGTSYITFNGINVQENTANNNITTGMEFGYGLLKNNSGASPLGCQDVIVQNCTISLTTQYSLNYSISFANPFPYGIYSDNITPGSNTQLTITNASGANSYNQFYNDSIYNVWNGIYCNGYSSYPDLNTAIALSVISSYGATGGSWDADASYGIQTTNQYTLTIANNTVNITANGQAGFGPVVEGIYTNGGNNLNIYNNTLTFNAIGNEVTEVFVINSSMGGIVNIYNNTISGSLSAAGGSRSIQCIHNSADADISIYNNSLNNIKAIGGPSSAFWGIYETGTTTTNNVKIYGNTFSHDTVPRAGDFILVSNYTYTGSAPPGCQVFNNTIAYNQVGSLSNLIDITIPGISVYSNTIHDVSASANVNVYLEGANVTSAIDSIYNNTIYNISTSNGGITVINTPANNPGYFFGNAIYNLSSASGITGINNTGSTNTHKIYENTIYNLSSPGGGIVIGMTLSNGTAVNAYKNWIYDLSSSTAAGIVYGINVTGGSTIDLYNNMIAGLTTPQSTISPAVYGLNLSGASTINAWYNSVYLTATGGPNYGSAGIYTNTAPTITLTNNLVVNNSTPNSGFTVAHWRSGNSFTNLTPLTNYNDYTSIVSGGLVYYDGTNSASTISTYTNYVSSEKNSISADPGFNPPSTVDLHETDMSNPTPLISAGTPVVGITDDFNGRFRSCPEIGCIEFAPCSLTISPNVTICQGTSTVLSVSGGYNYSWYPSANLSSSTSASVTANPTVTTTYTMTETTYDINLSTTVYVYNPALTATPNTTVCMGSSENLSVVGSSNYTWSPAVVLITTNGSSITASPTASTTYTITGTATNGCISLGATSVGIYTLPTLNTSPNLSICMGVTADLSAAGAVSYVWEPSLNLGSSTGAVVTATPTATTSYTVVGTDANGCISADAININVNPLPPVSAGPNVDICPLTSATLTATGASNYTWTPATCLNTFSGPLVVCSPTTLGTYNYTVTGTDDLGCSSYSGIAVSQVSSITANAGNDVTVCVPNCTTLNASGGISYTWYPATGLSATDVYNPTACPNQTTTYTLTAIGGIGCTASSSVTVYIASLPTITVSPDVTLCGGTSASLSAGGAATYTWSPVTGLSTNTLANTLADPNITTLYAVIGTDSNGCSSAPAAVNVTVLPLFSINPPVAVICDGSSTTLTANAASGAATPVNFTWEPAGSLNQDTGTVVIAFPTLSTSYTVMAVDVNSCISQVSFTVTVNPVPTITLSATATTICSGASATITASGAAGYTWTANPNTGASVKVQPAITTTYTVTGTTVYTQPDSITCSSSAEITIKVNPLPLIAVSPDQTIVIGNTTTLSVITQATNYQWVSDNNTLTCNDCTSPIANPAQTTTYYITVTDSNGCYAKDSILITVNIICGNIFVPEAFSPNADNVNDVLHVYGVSDNCIDPNTYTFQIFDRWGNKVFESSDPDQGWNGKYKGKELDEAVFVYELSYSANNINHSLKGNISLIK